MTALVVVAPTDAQLAYIAGLCEERGLEPYDPAFHRPDAPMFYGLDFEADDVPF